MNRAGFVGGLILREDVAHGTTEQVLLGNYVNEPPVWSLSTTATILPAFFTFSGFGVVQPRTISEKRFSEMPDSAAVCRCDFPAVRMASFNASRIAMSREN